MNEKICSSGALVGQAQMSISKEQMYNPTVGENLERRIASLESELERLKAARVTLGPLAQMRIQDLRDAMQY